MQVMMKRIHSVSHFWRVHSIPSTSGGDSKGGRLMQRMTKGKERRWLNRHIAVKQLWTISLFFLCEREMNLSHVEATVISVVVCSQTQFQADITHSLFCLGLPSAQGTKRWSKKCRNDMSRMLTSLFLSSHYLSPLLLPEGCVVICEMKVHCLNRENRV